MEPVVDQCLEWPINHGIEVAVRFALPKRCYLRHPYNWIAEELITNRYI